MSDITDAVRTTEHRTHEDLEALALRMAINNHSLIEPDTKSPYLEGRRNAFLLMAVAVETSEEPLLSRTVARLRHAVEAGLTDVDALRDIITRSTSRPLTPQVTLDWIGQKAFNARHGDRGLDEDFGMHWGTKHDVRISLKRRPGDQNGLLYAYDRTWDTYAVIADTTSRTLVHETFRRALATNPDMTAEEFGRHHHSITAAERTTALARAVSL